MSRERSGKTQAMPSVWAKGGVKICASRVQRGTEVHVQPIEGASNQVPYVGVSAMGSR